MALPRRKFLLRIAGVIGAAILELYRFMGEAFAQKTRLPTIGSDAAARGQILNDYLKAKHYAVYVNDFGTVGDNQSHPLSESYSTLAAAQVDYPAAMALTDEKDWCAWQAASNYIYARDDALNSSSPNNWSAGHIIGDGRYVLNRSVVFNHAAILIKGATPSQRLVAHSATTIRYNGANGTVDAPVSIFDCYLFNEHGNPPTGRKGNSTLSGGTKVEIRDILFSGKNGNMTANSSSVSGFVSGVRIRKASFVNIENCNFAGTLYDGITFTDAQLFCTIRRNNFYGVHRDAIQIQSATNFSTTVWICNNEFGFVGRYAILMDLMGSVEAMPIVRDNDFEHYYGSYFVNNPEWFVQGVVAGTCFINCGNLVFEANRCEAGTDATAKFYADVHLMCCTAPVLRDSIFRNLVVSARKRSAIRTSSATKYLTANRHLDITNERNYNAGISGDFQSACEVLSISKIYNLLKLLNLGGVGLSVSGSQRFEELTFTYLNIPTRAGAFATVAQPRNTALLTLGGTIANLVLTDVSVVDTSGVRIYGNFNHKTGNGDYFLRSGVASFRQWTPSTPYVATFVNEQLAPLRCANPENGRFYQCIIGGTSHTSPPTFPLNIGDEVTEATGVKWKCVGYVAYTSEDNVVEWQVGGKRRRHGNAAPTVGLWSNGDEFIFPSPSAGGYRATVCILNGEPGTWKRYGQLET